MGKAQNRIADADCSAQRCLNDAVCTDLLLGFTCGCPHNFTGPVCGQGNLCEEKSTVERVLTATIARGSISHDYSVLLTEVTKSFVIHFLFACY